MHELRVWYARYGAIALLVLEVLWLGCYEANSQGTLYPVLLSVSGIVSVVYVFCAWLVFGRKEDECC